MTRALYVDAEPQSRREILFLKKGMLCGFAPLRRVALTDRSRCSGPCVCLRSRDRRLADVGRHARPQHGLEREGAADRLGREDEEEHQVGCRSRLAELWQSGRRRRHGVRRHEQRGPARSEAARRSRRADGLSRDRRRVHVAAHAPEARGRPRQRLALSGRRFLATGRRQDAVLREQSRRAVLPSTSRDSATRKTTALSPTRSSPA